MTTAAADVRFLISDDDYEAAWEDALEGVFERLSRHGCWDFDVNDADDSEQPPQPEDDGSLAGALGRLAGLLGHKPVKAVTLRCQLDPDTVIDEHIVAELGRMGGYAVTSQPVAALPQSADRPGRRT